MRFVLTDKEDAKKDPLIFYGGIGAPETCFAIMEGGLGGWYGSPAIRQSAQDIDTRDGARAPIYKTQGTRVVTLAYFIIPSSSIDLATYIDSIYSFIGHDLELRCEDEFGVRISDCYISDDPDIQPHHSEEFALGSLTLTCPDPHKYSPDTTYAVANELVLENEGNIDAFPSFDLTGGVDITRITLKCDGNELVWVGRARTLHIDTREMTCSAGRFEKPSKVPVKSGKRTYYIQANTSLSGTVSLRSAWR